MATHPQSKDRHDSGVKAGSTKPDASPRAEDQRDTRDDHPLGGKSDADERRREVAEGDVSGDAPMDPMDKDFLKNAK